MTDPKTSYERRDEIRAADHDLNLINDQRTALILRLMWILLPIAVGGVFASGGAWFRIEELEARQTALETRVEAVISDGAATDRLAARLEERSTATLLSIQRIERLLERMQRNGAPAGP